MKIARTLSFFLVALLFLGCENNPQKVADKAVQIKSPQRIENSQSDLLLEEEYLTSKNLIDTNQFKKSSEKVVVREKPKTASTVLTFTPGLSFPACKSRWQFKSADWYKAFRDQVKELEGVSEKNIALICESADKSLIVGMLNGNIQETGGIVRYQVQKDTLEEARFTKDISLHLHEFKGRVENVIPVIGGIRDDKCTHTFRMNYDFLANEVRPSVKCSTCGKETEKCESL